MPSPVLCRCNLPLHGRTQLPGRFYPQVLVHGRPPAGPQDSKAHYFYAFIRSLVCLFVCLFVGFMVTIRCLEVAHR